IIPATCTECGVEERICYNCGTTETRTTDKIAHKYTTKIIKPTCKARGYTLHTCTCGKTYRDNYKNIVAHKNVKAKVVSPTVTSKGYTIYKCSSCGATIKKDFIPALISITKATVSGIKNTIYTGKQIKPAIKVIMGKTVLRNGKDYTVSYGVNKIRKATVKIEGKGKYAGTITKTFIIYPRKTTISVKSISKGKIIATAAKRPEAIQYQIQYCSNSKFKAPRTVVSTTPQAILTAKSQKIYYVRVRIGNGNYASGWSAVKKIKVK
ncbi:MAG: hypothetical protein ACI4SM_01300, partial [Candidatus Gastranaerophilaceae bacterium]